MERQAHIPENQAGSRWIKLDQSEKKLSEEHLMIWTEKFSGFGCSVCKANTPNQCSTAGGARGFCLESKFDLA
jgi:hypothetical protein